MAPEEKRDPISRMSDAYETMLERVDEMLEKAEKSAIPSLRKSLEQAREKAVELNELTREEAEKLAGYLERDIKDAAQLFSEKGEELRNWWQFDVKLVEQRLMEMFANVADRTRVELDRFAEQAREALDRVYYWTNGQPYLTQKLARAISREAIDDDVEEHVDRIVKQQFTGRAVLRTEPHLSHIHRQVAQNGKQSETDSRSTLPFYIYILRSR